MTDSSSATSVPAPPVNLAELFEVLESPLLIYAHKLVQNQDTAQDLVQQAFLILHKKMNEVTQHKAWLYRTVHNLAMNHHRSQKKIVPIQVGTQSEDAPTETTLEPTDPEALPDETLERLEAIGLTRLSIEKLPARERELIQLKFTDELSYKEIAAQTGLSVSNVGYILHHALKTLSLEIQKMGGGR